MDELAAYCVRCGAPQPRQQEFVDLLDNVSDRTASLLCYIPVFGVIPAIIFLAAHKFRSHPKVRFDAFQSVYLFVAFLLVSSALPAVFWLSFGHAGFHALVGLLKVAIFVCWVYLLVKASQEQVVRLPIIGDLAARSAAEQL